ncbi:arabinan endo-1,5-alpha-L-arabinosidase, partial [Actinoplanes sp. NPDC051633]
MHRSRLARILAVPATALMTALVAVAGTGSPALAAYPNPGLVTGDVLVHDPTVVRRPGGGYLVAHTG